MKHAFFILSLLSSDLIVAQSAEWVKYAVTFPDTKGVIDLNLLVKGKETFTTHPFLVMTAAKMNISTDDGQPSNEEIPMVEKFLKSVKNLMKVVQCKHVGNFTRDGVRINYFYVTDTLDLRSKFVDMYAKDYPKYNLGLRFKYEQKWQTYFEFLYPGDEIINVVKKERNTIKH